MIKRLTYNSTNNIKIINCMNAILLKLKTQISTRYQYYKYSIENEKKSKYILYNLYKLK